MKKISVIFLVMLIAVSLCVSCSNTRNNSGGGGSNQVKAKTLPDEYDVIQAVENQDTKALALALEKVPSLADTKVENGYSLLHLAIWKDNARLAKILLGNKADVEAKTDWGFTPIHELVRCDETNDRKEILEMLIFRRADVNSLTDSGNTPLDIAEIQDKQDFSRTLKHYGAKRVKEALDLPPLPDFVKVNNEIIEE